MCKKFKADREIVLEAVKKDTYALEYASSELKDDKELVLKALSANDSECSGLEYTSERLRDDEDIILTALEYGDKKYGTDAFEHASRRLQNDKMFLLKALQKGSASLEFTGDTLRKNREFIKQAIEIKGNEIMYADKGLLDDRELALLALSKGGGFAFKHLSDRLKDDKELALLAMNSGAGLAFSHVSDRLKDDKELALLAVRRNGIMINRISDRLKKDEDFTPYFD